MSILIVANGLGEFLEESCLDIRAYKDVTLTILSR
jgi:hypothetical protein